MRGSIISSFLQMRLLSLEKLNISQSHTDKGTEPKLSPGLCLEPVQACSLLVSDLLQGLFRPFWCYL